MSGLRKALLSFSILLIPFLMTGCGDLVEIDDRDFVLALGISYEDEIYQVTYSLPDLGKLTDQPVSDTEKLLRTYEGGSIKEIEQQYNANSENRLDYRHLQIIILDDSICRNKQAMKNLLTQINDNYDISHNVLVYYYEYGVKELMDMEDDSGSIGEHLKKLNSNNYVNGMESAKIGTLINCITNERILFIPALLKKENSIAVNGGIFFRENQLVRQISQIESEYYFISLGKGSDYLLRISPEHMIQLKEIQTKTSYSLVNGVPNIGIKITGSANIIPGDITVDTKLKQTFNQYIQSHIILELNEFMKGDKIDYLNLYENSSYKHKEIWLRYGGNGEEFIKDTVVNVTVDIQYE